MGSEMCIRDSPDAEGCDGNSNTDTQSGGGMTNAILYAGIGAVVLLLIFIISLLVVRRSRKSSDDDVTGFAGVAGMDPMEAYVQQLIAQGYPEDTARQYAQQYAGHFQDQQQ